MSGSISTGLLVASLLALAALAAGVAISVGPLFRWARADLARRPRALLLALGLAAIGSGALLLRPHEDTFIGLDTSGYRHMAGALAEGRPLHSTDAVLAGVPQDLRTALLLLPDMRWRNTRDRSFQLMSTRTCATEPFFYPLLPLAAVGFDLVVPGKARDYLVPVIGWIFVMAMLSVAAARGGGWGLALGAAAFAGSPLPLWFLRGYFPEALGAVLVAATLVRWAVSHATRPPASALFPLGLALSLHPLLVALVAPAILLLLGTPGQRRRDTLSALAALAIGLAPLYVMTTWVCRPYGDIFSARALLENMRQSGEHRVVMGAALSAIAVLAAGLFALPRARRDAALARGATWLATTPGRGAWFAACAIPLALAWVIPTLSDPVRQGAHEFAQAIRPAFGVLLAALLLAAAFRGASVRLCVATGLACALMPAFFYLKGVESAGLWSQRRLLPGYLVMLAMAIAAAPVLASWWGSRRRPWPMNAAAAAGLFVAALWNAVHWPAPYLARYEAGASRWVAQLRATVGGRLTFFDYHPYSFPLAVDGSTRVIGLGESSTRRIGDVMAWLGERARQEDVLVATAFANPGLEDGIVLRSVVTVSTDVTRVRSKAALPAVAYGRAVAVEFLAAEPAGAERPARRVAKVLDGGPMALRGPWHAERRSLDDAEGRAVPAQWCRQGAGVVGPWPAPGEWIRIAVRGHAGRRNPTEPQLLHVNAPWGSFSAPLVLSNGLDAVSVYLPAPSSGPAGGTGLYRLFAEKPYDPRSEGIRGYPADLGALIHEVVIEIVPVQVAAGER